MGIPGSPWLHTPMAGTLSILPWSLAWVKARTLPREAWVVQPPEGDLLVSLRFDDPGRPCEAMGAAPTLQQECGQLRAPVPAADTRPVPFGQLDSAGSVGLSFRGPITWAKSGFCPLCLPNFTFLLKKKFQNTE